MMCQEDYHTRLQEKQLPTLWEIPDEMWNRIKTIMPIEKESGTPGRPNIPFRTVLNGILFVLRTGCQWKATPKEYGSGSTVHRRFQEWEQADIMDQIIKLMLNWYDQVRGIDWEWQSGDTKLLAAPIGGEETGRNPTDRGKCGTKRHTLVDGRGAPLAFHLSAANRHDMKGLKDLLSTGMLLERPQPSENALQHLCLDKGYDYEQIDELVDSLGYISHIKRCGQDGIPGIGEPVYPARRWKVERTISWLNNMRKLRTRWEKKARNYRALWLLAASLIVYRLIVLG
jgi:putative transposase